MSDDSLVLYRCPQCSECTACDVLGMEYMCRNCGRTMKEDGVWVRQARADEAEALLAECTGRFHAAVIASGSDKEFADIAVQKYRAFLEGKP